MPRSCSPPAEEEEQEEGKREEALLLGVDEGEEEGEEGRRPESELFSLPSLNPQLLLSPCSSMQCRVTWGVSTAVCTGRIRQKMSQVKRWFNLCDISDWVNIGSLSLLILLFLPPNTDHSGAHHLA